MFAFIQRQAFGFVGFTRQTLLFATMKIYYGRAMAMNGMSKPLDHAFEI